MPRQKRAVRHHTVTRSYLDLFADAKGQIMVFDKSTGDEYPTNPINAAVVGEFNTVNLPGLVPDAVEKALAAGEGPAVAAITKMRAGAFPTERERASVAWFVALHFARSPGFRRFLDDLTKSLDAWLSEMKAAMVRAGDVPSEALALLKTNYALDQNEKVASMLELIEGSRRQLIARSWTIAEVSDMITSDFPVLLNSDPAVARFGEGLGSAQEVAFPLGPSHVLVLSKPYGGPNRRVTLTEEGESDLRRLRVAIRRSPHVSTSRNPATHRLRSARAEGLGLAPLAVSRGAHPWGGHREERR